MQNATATSPSSKPTSLVGGFRNELELLSRHIRMLQFVEKHGPIGIIRLSQLLGVPKHKVRYSLRILEREGFIKPTATGALATEKVATFLEQMQTMLADVVREMDGLQKSLQKK